MEVRRIKETKKSKLNGVETSEWVEREFLDEEALDQYIDNELFAGEFDPDKINGILKENWNVENFKVYHQCTNIELERESLALDDIYEDLRKIEKSFVGYDIDQDESNITYLQFHMYMLLFVIGEDKVKNLIQIRNTWPDDQKEAFLNDIRKNLDNLVA